MICRQTKCCHDAIVLNKTVFFVCVCVCLKKIVAIKNIGILGWNLLRRRIETFSHSQEVKGYATMISLFTAYVLIGINL